MLKSLRFLPKENIMLEYTKVKQLIQSLDLNNTSGITKFLTYSQSTYLLPTKSILNKLSTVYRLLKDIPLTINVAESFNRNLNSKLKKGVQRSVHFERHKRNTVQFRV